MSQKYQCCTKCVMDNVGDDKITFDENGVCNYCYYFDTHCKPQILDSDEGLKKFNQTINLIRKNQNGKKYDCLIGLSGGVDSSYVAYLAWQQNLNPLCVHFDNGWNSELAVKNIEKIVSKFGFDLKTYVINWEEFRSLQRAYFKAGVIDIEALTDHAIFASLYKITLEEEIPYVLSGFNLATECIMPVHWTHKKSDYINIIDIYDKFGEGLKLKTFPFMDMRLKRKYKKKSFEVFEILNWIQYDKKRAKELLVEKIGWKDYGGKHYESVFTKFYQAYILPTKFSVDKRKAHLSSLICSGQMTRQEALLELKMPLYKEEDLRFDKNFILKKLGFSEIEFDELMRTKPKLHSDFKVEGSLFYYYPIFSPLKPVWERLKRKLGR